ncbi:hypothetical protein [Kitasatospora cheerisanensis]|uniref:Uncharacterized protein n=1 Tax=Kitasatospora cheerisanensis KCTC 2395 TaxID=1348663 RepID=A0A066YTI4_9ACTN|nr:hypothetical protein [Kitasatospora cheerisanensis]KDN81406.1 hypothetical protein KCH_68530 [Kitasatospora cheerisanensis KCTC 2395]
MTLHLSQPPAGALNAVRSALAPGAALPPSAAAVLRHSAGRPEPLLALPVHALRGPAPRLAEAECTGWRFLLRAARPAAAGPHCPHESCDAAGAAGAAADVRPERPLMTGEFTEDGLEQVVAAAEVAAGADGPVFSHLSAGPFLDSTVRALRQAWQLVHLSPARYEPRLLPLPEHYASALWLHGELPAEDLLIPLAPAPLGVAAHQVLPAAELLARLANAPAARPTALIG